MSERTEIIEGERYASPAATREHQEVVGRVLSLLLPFVNANKLGEVIQGPVDVRFQDGDSVQPDLVFVRSERAHIITERGVEGAPDVIVEVVSSATATLDYHMKRDRYAHFGVPEYWIVDPQKRELAIWTPENRLRPRLCVDANEAFTWHPRPDGAALTIRISELLHDID
ncbi:MAG TPA: Uma2 family endonuclease [Longimicrobium sp.]|jgi:Uma2 family endonuclease